jgi:hypothetical protein
VAVAQQSRRVAELSARAAETQRRAASAKIEADRLARASRQVTAETRERLSQNNFASAIAELWSGGH